jgi:hypothetical protein
MEDAEKKEMAALTSKASVSLDEEEFLIVENVRRSRKAIGWV